MKLEQVINSALWAAYGDALGFVTELGNEKTVEYRLYGQRQRWGEQAWRRHIGGRGGVEVVLPAGTYSDDTQLRLAVSRSITSSGVFQREAFAKIELPVWRSYALGGGLGTMAAAENLIKLSASWYSNQFHKGTTNYYQAGGNGAAMRIQPHIWASADTTHPNVYLLDVLADAIITHGHGRGILGAAFHAVCLASTLTNRAPIPPKMWDEGVRFLSNVPSIMEKELELSGIWLQQWQSATNENFQAHIDTVVKEFIDTISMFDVLSNGSPASRYESFAKKINAVGGKEVGSGVKTSILAMAAAYLFRDEDPEACLKTVAGLLHSDTDTIATMAGALIGSSACEAPRQPVQDSDYITNEAKRLANLRNHGGEPSFVYPSVISWRPERTALDQIAAHNGGVYLGGLGKLELDETSYPAKTASWCWGKLPFGQTVLAKTRVPIPAASQAPAVGAYEVARPSGAPCAGMVILSDPVPVRHQMYPRPAASAENLLYAPAKEQPKKSRAAPKNRDVNHQLPEVLAKIEQRGFAPEEVGRAILEIFTRGRFIEATEFLVHLYKKFHARS